MSKVGQSSKPKILVVDDERVIADTLAIILNQSGFDASAVYTGTGAVEHAREHKPDLIISDVIMPDMNGIEAAIKIREILPGCKILLFSGQAATADLLEKARLEGHEFEILAKPVHPQDLLAKLRG
jgi:CheY-like chemotaxis protein